VGMAEIYGLSGRVRLAAQERNEADRLSKTGGNTK